MRRRIANGVQSAAKRPLALCTATWKVDTNKYTYCTLVTLQTLDSSCLGFRRCEESNTTVALGIHYRISFQMIGFKFKIITKHIFLNSPFQYFYYSIEKQCMKLKF